MDDFNTQIMHYREEMEKQKRTSAQVISTEMDTMKKHLEDQARGLERREQAELLRKVKEMVESVSKQAESLQKSFLTINDGLDTRFTLFEEFVQARLDAITAQVRGNMHIDMLEQGVNALRQNVLEIELQQNMTLGDAKRIESRLSCIDDATAAALPLLVAGWGNGQFPSQEAFVAFIEAKLDGIITDSTTMASLAALGELQTTMGSKMSSLEDKMSTCDGMLQFVLRQQPGANGAAAASSSSLKTGANGAAAASSLKTDDLRATIEDQIEQAIAKLHSEQRVISHDQMAMNQGLLSAQADSKQLQEEFKRDLEQLTLASKAGVQRKQADSEQQLKRDLKLFPLVSVAGTRGRQPEDLDEKSMLDGGLDETPMRLGGRPSSEDFGLEASQREFLAVVAQHGGELAKICSRLDDLESCSQSHICDEEHVSALEEGLQYLNERIVAIEKTQACQNQPASPQPPARGRPGPRRFSHAEEPGPGMSQIMSMREEIQRFRGRLVGVEQTLQQLPARAVQDAPKNSSADLKDFFDKQLQELYDFVKQGSDDSQNQGFNLLKAVRDSQRTTDLTRSKLEDLTNHFSKLNLRFEASVPQLLHLVLELSRRGGGGTGETYGDDLMDDFAEDRTSVAGAVSVLQDLLYGCADGSGVAFVSPITMREALAGFEQLIKSQISKFQEDMIADLYNKADREETSTMSAELQSAQQRIQVLGQHLFQILSSKEQPDGDSAALSRVQLCGRCLSCDKAVDMKGRWRSIDWDHFAGGSPRPASPLTREARPLSGLRRHIERSLPAVDHGRPR